MAESAESKKDIYGLASMGNILVTGGCGFLGTHIVLLLLAQTTGPTGNVHVVDIRAPAVPRKGATYHTADITSTDSVRTLLETVKPNVVIHTVSPVFQSGGGAKAKELMYKVNVQGTQTLLDEARRVGTRVFVHTSSPSVISDQTTDMVNADERWTVIRGSAQPEYYSDTKAEAEENVLAASSRALGAHGVPFLTTAIRPAAMFGEMDVQMIPNVLGTLRDGQTNFQLGENDNLFDFTYVGNVAHAHLLAAARLVELSKTLETQDATGSSAAEKNSADDDDAADDADANKVDGEAFLITNHAPVYFWDFFHAVWNAYYPLRPTKKPPAAKQQIFKLPRGLAIAISALLVFLLGLVGKSPRLQPARVRFTCMTRYFRTRKAEACLGYAPAFTLDEGIARTVRWFAQKDAENEAAAANASTGPGEAKKDR